MAKILFIVFTLGLANAVIGQKSTNKEEPDYRKCLTIGFLQGGGGLIGADFEILLSKKIGVQAGAGILAWGAGLNYHFNPAIRSSFLTLQYRNIGMREFFAMSQIASSFVYRGKKWFTGQLGLGIPIDTGPYYSENNGPNSVFLVFSIGGYIPFR